MNKLAALMIGLGLSFNVFALQCEKQVTVFTGTNPAGDEHGICLNPNTKQWSFAIKDNDDTKILYDKIDNVKVLQLIIDDDIINRIEFDLEKTDMAIEIRHQTNDNEIDGFIIMDGIERQYKTVFDNTSLVSK